MVKLTIVGRVIDGLPLAHLGPRYVDEDNGNLSHYKQRGEMILEEVSRGALAPSKMTVRVDHNSFHYLVGNGVCFITLCDSSYPRKLAFHYLQDLQREFEKLDKSLPFEKIKRPYSFVKFDGVIGNIRKQYIDTRTQANLSKLNANRQKDLDIATEHLSTILERRRNSEMSERTQASASIDSPIWGSPRLEVIALRWTPITLIAIVAAAVLLWANFILTDDFLISSS